MVEGLVVEGGLEVESESGCFQNGFWGVND
jgi:hypothetical protein